MKRRGRIEVVHGGNGTHCKESFQEKILILLFYLKEEPWSHFDNKPVLAYALPEFFMAKIF